jgi:DNA-binding response OmpR family regulator
MPHCILIAEDDKSILALLVAVLEDDGYRVRRAADGAVALALLERERADLLLTDNMMPRLGGLALIARLRAADSIMPTILMSAVALAPPPAPPTVFLPKPFDLDDLLSAVARLLRR